MEKYVGAMVRKSIRVQIVAENESDEVGDLDGKLEYRRIFLRDQKNWICDQKISVFLKKI